MNTVRRGKRQVKGEEPKRVTLADFALHAPVDTLVELIQALIPLGLMAVGDCLKADVARLAGARYRRGDGLAGHVRWGRQRGSVYLADQKLPIQVPRVRNRLTGQEAPLETYTRLQRPRGADAGLFRRVLKGLSCRDYPAFLTTHSADGLSGVNWSVFSCLSLLRWNQGRWVVGVDP